MIDIHSHLLPGVDDGSPDLQSTLEMLAFAYESGTDTIVLTPHCNVNRYDNYFTKEFYNKYVLVCEKSRELNIPIRILLGQEVFGNRRVVDLIKDGKLITLNKTKNLLIEFDFEEDDEYIMDILKSVKKIGLTPVVAHPERYEIFWKYPEILFDIKEMGCYLQVNKGSILGRFGRRVWETVDYILTNRLADVVASDAHGLDIRTPDLSETKIIIEQNFSTEYAQDLLVNNPAKILQI